MFVNNKNLCVCLVAYVRIGYILVWQYCAYKFWLLLSNVSNVTARKRRMNAPTSTKSD